MGRWSGLIVVAILVVQIVASIIQQRRKEQEKQRAREAAARRQMLAEAEAPAGQAGQSVPTMTQPGVESPTAAADLEARRRAQLEQLRQRREGRRIGLPSASGAGQAPPTGPRAGLPVPGVRTQASPPSSKPQSQPWTATSDQARSRQQEVERRAREQARLVRDQQARVAEERDAAQRAASERERLRRAARESQQQSRQAEQRQADQRQAAAAMAIGGPVPVLQLRNRLSQPGALREVFLLKELLDPPVALRGQGHSPAG